MCVCSTGSLPGQCNFESGVCGYIQDKKEDKADWLRVRGYTPTSYTGPRGDHTTGVGESFPHLLLYSFTVRDGNLYKVIHEETTYHPIIKDFNINSQTLPTIQSQLC